jgi:hypothetical protein
MEFGEAEQYEYHENMVFMTALSRNIIHNDDVCNCFDSRWSDYEDEECYCDEDCLLRIKDPRVHWIRAIVRLVAPDNYLVTMPADTIYIITIWEGNCLDSEISQIDMENEIPEWQGSLSGTLSEEIGDHIHIVNKYGIDFWNNIYSRCVYPYKFIGRKSLESYCHILEILWRDQCRGETRIAKENAHVCSRKKR